MKILELELKNIRNFKHLRIDLSNPLTLIYGRNSEGKTNLLESIHFLTLTKSLKKGKEKDIILRGQRDANIRGLFKTEQGEKLEIEFILGNKKIGKVNNVPSKMKEILGLAESVLFTVEDLDTIENPQKKRKFLNILLSLLSKKYFLSLSEYQQALKRRNKTLALLKNKRVKIQELDFWDEKLATLGEYIIRKRKEVALKINKLLRDDPIFFKSPLCLEYRPHASSKEELLALLQRNTEKDIILCQTTVGPHRDTIEIKGNGLNLELYSSRSEKRGAIIELKKASLELIKREKKVTPILLLDDVFSELDNENRKHISSLIKNQQTIITTTNPEHLKDELKNAKAYKLENGRIL